MSNDDRKNAWRDRQTWMEDLVADGSLSRGELAVGMCLAFHKNLQSGQCNPSLERIAMRAGMKVRNAQYALARLEKKGRIRRHMGGHGPRNSTQYELVRVQYSAPLEDSPRVQADDARVQSAAAEGANARCDGCSGVHPNLENIDLNHNRTVCADTHPTIIEVLDGKEGQPPTDIEIEAGFQEFWRQYPRAVDMGEAKAKYRKAIKAGKATIMQINHAAMIYAAARWEANQDHYTKTPANWLANECWGDDPGAHALGARGGLTRSRLARMKENARQTEEHARQRREQRDEWIKKANAPPPAPDPTWTKVCTALREEIGDGNYKRFFSDVAFEAIESGTVYLRTPAPYDARKINKDYGALLLELWKVETESVRAVTVVVGRSTMRRTGT
jgi:hypothetical protein